MAETDLHSMLHGELVLGSARVNCPPKSPAVTFLGEQPILLNFREVHSRHMLSVHKDYSANLDIRNSDQLLHRKIQSELKYLFPGYIPWGP